MSACCGATKASSPCRAGWSVYLLEVSGRDGDGRVSRSRPFFVGSGAGETRYSASATRLGPLKRRSAPGAGAAPAARPESLLVCCATTLAPYFASDADFTRAPAAGGLVPCPRLAPGTSLTVSNRDAPPCAARVLGLARLDGAAAAAARLAARGVGRLGATRGVTFGDVALLAAPLPDLRETPLARRSLVTRAAAAAAGRAAPVGRRSKRGVADVGAQTVEPWAPVQPPRGSCACTHFGPGSTLPVAGEASRGDPLYLVTSPFGLLCAPLFCNSVTAGVLANVMRRPDGDRPALLLTDARVHPGSEGGAAFDAAGGVVGLVAPALTRKTGKAVELTLLYPVGEIVERLSAWWRPPKLGMPLLGPTGLGDVAASALMALPARAAATLQPAMPQQLRRAYRCLVLVQTAKMWASGVLVSPRGDVLTCAHVFDPPAGKDAAPAGYVAPSVRNVPATVDVHVDWYDDDSDRGAKLGDSSDATSFRAVRRTHHIARVLYCSRGDLDVALLRIVTPKPDVSKPSPPASIPREWPYMPLRNGNVSSVDGDCVWALGHALFGREVALLPTLCRGVLSKVVRLRGRDAILQSSASVFGGHSGGMLLNEGGDLLGLIASNSVSAAGDIIPDINHSIPTELLVPIVAACCARRKPLDDKASAALDVHDDALLAIWDLRADADEEDAGVGAVPAAATAVAPLTGVEHSVDAATRPRSSL